MISTPDAVLQAVIKRALIDSGCPTHIVTELMENAHERRWPNGLSNAIPGTLLIYITVIPPSVWYIADAFLSIFLSCGSVHHYSLIVVLGTWKAFVLVITSLLAILVITSLLAHFS